MKYFRFYIIAVLILTTFNLFGQSDQTVEMADVLRRDGKIYTVVAGLVIILTAMIILLIKVDRKIFRLENQIKKEK
jgi:uncharacterized membrane protein YcjF (UPF0283 family)